jgi:hypothetical protein
MYALKGDAKRASKRGLGFTSFKTGADNLVAVSDRKGVVMRLRERTNPCEDAGNGTSHWL